jgi:hypothetical protein
MELIMTKVKNFARFTAIVAATFAVIMLASQLVYAGKQESREYHLKAAFLRYVAKFVEWPEGAIPESEVNICILGQIPSFKGLRSINGKVVNDREIKVSKISNYKDAEGQCQLMFVAKTEIEDSQEIIDFYRNKPILTFGDIDDFARKGGGMNFYIMNNRLAIMINPPSMDDAGLKISPRMLRLVTVVPPIDQSGIMDN